MGQFIAYEGGPSLLLQSLDHKYVGHHYETFILKLKLSEERHKMCICLLVYSLPLHVQRGSSSRDATEFNQNNRIEGVLYK